MTASLLQAENRRDNSSVMVISICFIFLSVLFCWLLIVVWVCLELCCFLF